MARDTTGTVEAFVAALPKVELHVHLLGSADLTTVADLARGHPQGEVPTDPEELAAYYEFTNFDHFLDVYVALNRLVTTGESVERLIIGLAETLAADNVRYAEVTVTPLSHLKVGIDPAELADALESGRLAARACGVEIAWIFDVSGDDGLVGAWATLDWILRHQPVGTVAFGLGGPETGVPRAAFHDAFASARAAGLRSVPHAGETTGPGEVLSALTELRADRIGHGIAAADAPRLLAHLAEHDVPLEVCVTSNLRTGAVGSWAEHPLPSLLTAGVPVTLGTDDPGMFGTTLSREYVLCATRLGLDSTELASVTRAGIDAAFCSPATRRALHAELDDALGTVLPEGTTPAPYR
ncbi:adenosine deaminase [Saccharomonospora iraqiensis]|uniref:adenosine deaminase n=1 Tax=Saccharomonospora iraqiensis TaxID=52698 RepID=UPI00022DE921|nr:adenosine deaminase [Saccharomonospora iraqiensis]